MREEFTRVARAQGRCGRGDAGVERAQARLDPRAYNGASMVGLNGVVIKSHGGADRVSFANAVRVAITEARNGVPAQIGAWSQELARARGSAAAAASDAS